MRTKLSNLFLVAMLPFACTPTSPAGSTRASATEEALTTCVTLNAAADALLSNPPIDQNFGTLQTLRVGGKDESLIRFNLASIPTAAAVNSATLQIYISGSGSNGQVNLHRALAPWTETSVTYATFGQSYDPVLIAAFTTTSSNSSKSIDLTAQVKSWVSNAQANNGVLLETPSDKKAILVSREGGTPSQRPQLQVCYTVPDDHCTPNPCQNAGACQNTATTFSCQCAPGWTGATCATLIDNCAANPCLNGGTCATGVDSYTCTCATGYAGANCQTLIDNCASGPCLNGGVCQNAVGSYVCQCAPGWTGTTCATLIDNCSSSPCLNGGTCTNGVNGYTCSCPAGYSGANCQDNINECATQPCQNGGTCVDGVNSYTCSCAPGWGGAHCELNLHSCSNNPCLNGGACTNLPNAYSCACAAGYTGANCEIDINECAPQPCHNGGICVDGVARYTCLCPAGYSGPSCDTKFYASGATLSFVQGVSPDSTTVLATLTDNVPGDNPVATVAWDDQTQMEQQLPIKDNGDGTRSILVDGSHWFAATGTYDIIIRITSPSTKLTTQAHATATVTPQLAMTGTTLLQTQGVPLDYGTVLATLTDARGTQWSDDVNAIVESWGDGSYGGQFTPTKNNGDGTWSVLADGTHAFPGIGIYDVVIRVTSSVTQASVLAHTTVIAGPQLSATGASLNAVQGVALDYTTVLATVTDARGTQWSDNLDATIESWGDASYPEGFAPIKNNGDGTWSVLAGGTHAYTLPGTYDVVIRITSSQTHATASTHATVVVPGSAPAKQLSLTGSTFAATQGTLLPYGSVIATFTDTVAYDNVDVWVDWGDGSNLDKAPTSWDSGGLSGTLDGSNGHFYSTTGVFTVTLWLVSARTSEVAVGTATAQVGAQLALMPSTFAATQGVQLPSDTVIATFTDSVAYDSLDVWVDWGDGSSLDKAPMNWDSGGLSGTIVGSNAHTFVRTGTFLVTMWVSSSRSQAVVATTSTALVGAELTVTGLTFNATQATALTSETVIATFTDAEPHGSLDVWVDWGDGSSLDKGQLQYESDGLSGSITSGSGHAYASPGTFGVTFWVDAQHSAAVGIGASTANVLPLQICSGGTCACSDPSLTPCGSACANLSGDFYNCGACGNACAAGQACIGGTCLVPGCPAGFDTCGHTCTQVAWDSSNCGACGNICPSGQSCLNGACTFVCTSPKVMCGGACIDTSSDSANCGACGHVCPSGFSCQGSVCTGSSTPPPPTCTGSQTVCGSGCVDTSTADANCGSCGHACTGGLHCTYGQCVQSCGPGTLTCNGACIDPDTSPSNCGACGHACTGGSCQHGACVCSDSETMCGGQCVDTQWNNANCGGCGIACNSGTSCQSGHCGPCAAGQVACNGVCTSLQTDVNNCGHCGAQCDSCQNGTCHVGTGVFCLADTCGTECTDRDVDPVNCGTCGRTVTGGAVCQGGNLACPVPYSFCGQGSPSCVLLTDDSNNCGSCGFFCAPGTLCRSGVCVTP
jgi:hypothetical protein